MIESPLTMKPTPGILRILVLLGVTAATSVATGAGWWNRKYSYRQEVKFEPFQRSGLPGSEVGVVTLFTGGKSAPDGSDVRVATAKGKEVPSLVLMTGPGDRLRVAFRVRSDIRTYYVYFGAKEPAAPKELELRRGVLLETWANPGGSATTVEEARSIIAKATKLLGRDFCDRVFLGHNPFGPQNKIVSVFTGHLICPKDGKYSFASSSQDASFLLIDDKVVVRNGGLHPPQGRVEKTGSISLKRGLHKLTFYHICTGGNPVAVAAWRPPGQRNFVPIQAEAFGPVWEGKPGPIERRGRNITVSFVPQHKGESFMGTRYFQAYRFEPLIAGRSTGNVELKWDFGDGDVSTSRRGEHVYLLPGQYTVKLTARSRTAAKDVEWTNRLFVSRPWDKTTQRDLDDLSHHGRIVAGYRFESLDTDALGPAMQLLARTGQRQALLRAGAALLSRDGKDVQELAGAMSAYADALVDEGQPKQAVDALLRASKMPQAPAVAATLLVKAGRITLDELGRPEQAIALFEQVAKKYSALTTAPVIRNAQIGNGDSFRILGNRAKAAEAYREASVLQHRGPGKLAFARGDYARHVEEYIRTGNDTDAAEFLDRWAQAIPSDKLDGYWSLMTVRLAVARGRYADAAGEAEILLSGNPSSQHAPAVLMLAADAYEKLNRVQQSRAALKRVVAKYPESPLAKRAAARLTGGTGS